MILCSAVWMLSGRLKSSGVFFVYFVYWPADLEARERQAEAEAQKREEFNITRTLEEEVRTQF